MTFYRRRLPHWQPDGTPLFLTWRLVGSLPKSRQFTKDQLSAGAAFVAMDRILHRAETGPLWLQRDELSGIVVEALIRGELLNRFELHSYVVMPNHVHMLITPFGPVAGIMRSVKSASAVQCNRILDRTGKRFWQDEYYDHWVRNPAEFGRIERYILKNPVEAGLCGSPEEFRWSSAWAGSGRKALRSSEELPHKAPAIQLGLG